MSSVKTTKSKSSKTKSTKHKIQVKVSSPQDEEVNTNADSNVEVEDNNNVEEGKNEESEETPVSKLPDLTLANELEDLFEYNKMASTILSQVNKTTRSMASAIKKIEKELNKHDIKKEKNKNSKGSNGNKALKQLRPIYTTEMTSFFQNNLSLTDKHDEIICEQLTYESDGTLLVSRDQVLKMVTSYIRVNELQKYEDKRRIKMDTTLKELFPELAEVKSGKKVTQEENCYYSTLMGAISRHFKAKE